MKILNSKGGNKESWRIKLKYVKAKRIRTNI